MDTLAITYAGNSGAVDVPFTANMEWAMRPVAKFIRALLRDNSAFAPEVDVELARRIMEQSAPAASAHWLEADWSVETPEQEVLAQALMAQRQKNQAAIQLLQEWLADESGYDEYAWPIVKKAIEENRTSYRSRFSE